MNRRKTMQGSEVLQKEGRAKKGKNKGEGGRQRPEAIYKKLGVLV